MRLQEFLSDLHGSMEVSSPVLLQVEDERLHAFLLQFLHALAELVVRGSTKITNTDIAHLGTYHICGINRMNGNLVTNHLECQLVLYAPTDDTQHGDRSLRPTQTLHNLLFRHLNTCNGGIIDADDTVASQNAHTFRRAVGDGLNDEERILNHIELHTNAFEITLQGLIGFLNLLSRQIGGVRVQFLYHATNAVLNEFILVDRIDIEIGNSHFGNLQFSQGRVLTHADGHLGRGR